MPEKVVTFQPGAMLHDAILGALRASGSTFEGWCAKNKVNPSNARNATCGVRRGPKAEALLAGIIADAGPEVVEVGYLTRLRAHVAEFERAA